jgi:predicted ATPase
VIRSIQFVTSHYAARLPGIGMKRLAFPGKGLIVLFGPNGCGKSTLLRGMAMGSACARGGWSKAPEPFLGGDGKPMNQILEQWGAVVDWDGTASLYLDSGASDQNPHSLEDNPDGLEEGEGQIMCSNALRLLSPSSSGQWRVSRLEKALDDLRKGRIPDLSFSQWQDANSTCSTWAAAGRKFAEYVKTRQPTETPALLLDEPERSLSISNAIKLFHEVLLVTGSLVQVFVATHSPFVLDLDGNPHVHLVDMQEGYADDCRASLRKICHGFSERKKG